MPDMTVTFDETTLYQARWAALGSLHDTLKWAECPVQGLVESADLNEGVKSADAQDALREMRRDLTVMDWLGWAGPQYHPRDEGGRDGSHDHQGTR
jgi:hypothetical protein